MNGSSKKARVRTEKKKLSELARLGREVRVANTLSPPSPRSEYAKKAKQPRAGANPASILQMTMKYSLLDADRDGSWSWGPRDWSTADWDALIKPKLDAFEQMTWGELHSAKTGTGEKRRSMHHDMETKSLCVEAQERKKEKKRMETKMFRFRLSGTGRLWGFRVVDKFHIFWYDPEHKIYPVD